MLSLLKYTRILKGCHYSTFRLPFPLLGDNLANSRLDLTTAKENSQKIIEEITKINKLCYDGGGERGYNLHVKKNKKILPRERIASILDEGEEPLELCLQAGVGMEYGDIYGGGCIGVVGKIQGVYCVVSSSDATLKAGTSFPITVKKHQRIAEITSECSLPRINFVDSGGAYLPLQAQIFPDKLHGGRAFYNLALESSAGIPTMTVVCGSCTAGGAYVPKMSEEAAIVDKIGTVYLGGPPLVKAALGEDVTHEDLGGAMMHCSISGGIDYFCPNEQDSFEIVKDFASTIDLGEEETLPDNDALYSPDDLDVLCGLEFKDRNTLYGILSRITDGSRFREFKEKYGQNLVAGFCFVGRERLAFLGNCGPLSYEDGLKGAHFLQICEHRRLPILFMQNSGPEEAQKAFLDSLSEEEMARTLKGRAVMAASIATSTAFKVTLNVGGCHGDEHYTLCGSSFHPNFIFSWPGVSSSHSMELFSTHPSNDTSKIKQKPTKSAFTFSSNSSLFYSTRLLNDGIIMPSETRKALLKCMKVYQQKKKFSQFEKTFPVFRL